VARFDEATQSQIPAMPEMPGWRHFGDGVAGKFVAARLQGYYSGGLSYVDLAVDAGGILQTSGGGGGGGPATIADGADVAEGALADVKVVGDTAGSVSAKLRGINSALAGTLTVGSHNVTNAGTFAVQATLAAETTKVIGTVNQGTSPWVTSRNWTLAAAGDAVNVGQWIGSAAPTVGSKASASSIPVVIASDQAVFTVQAIQWSPTGVGNAWPVKVTDGANITAVKAASTAAVATDPAAVVAISPNNTVAVTAPTLTKGTQGANGWSVQNLKDSGRVNIALTIEFAFAQIAETLLTVTESRDGAATGTFTSKAITNGKRIRFTGGFATIETLGTGTTVPQRMYLRLRINTAGATTAASPLQYVFGLGISTGSAAIPVKSSVSNPIVIPDGVEYAGSATATYGLTLETPDWVVTTGTGRCKITLFAFEY